MNPGPFLLQLPFQCGLPGLGFLGRNLDLLRLDEPGDGPGQGAWRPLACAQ